MLKNTLQKYGSVAKFFHWVIALLIIGMLCIGFYMDSLGNSPGRFKLVGWHKSVGISILLLAVLRLTWKFVTISPPLPNWMSKLDRFAAHSAHMLLYVIMLVMPLSGWAMSSAMGYHVSVFGLFTLPDLIAPDKDAGHTLSVFHGYLAWVIVAVVTLHALAALLHHFYYRDTILRRMLPFAQLNEENDAHHTRPADLKL
jgi:cytochrome b561